MLQCSTGELGTLNLEGRQVGGFFDWEIQVSIYISHEGNLRASKVGKWQAIGKSYWLLEKVSTDKLEAIFYCFNGVDFKRVSHNSVRVVLPAEYPISVEIKAPLVMYG